MSSILYAQIWDTKINNPTLKLVLLKLTDNSCDEGYCIANIPMMADFCDLTTKQLIKSIDFLIKCGFLHEEEPDDFAPTPFQLTLEQGDTSLLPSFSSKE